LRMTTPMWSKERQSHAPEANPSIIKTI